MKTDVLSPEILANHVGILGKTGSGKSNLAKVVAEELLAEGKRVVVLDPTGTWYGLRLTRRQKPSPYKVVIFGGAHGDIPIAEHHGGEIAAALARSSTSAIIDTRQMTVRARTRFATDFAETLLRQNVGTLYVIVDESHLFAPQGKVPDPDAGKMLHAWNNLASLGRGVGLVLILISQRPAKLHKDSLTQIETLVAMRLIGPQDRAAIREWIKESADEDQGAEIMKSLPGLPTGTGWVWSPGLDILQKRSFPLASTLDTGKPSEAPDVPLGPIDVDAIRAQLGKVEEERKANDPTLLKAEIRRLEAEIRESKMMSPKTLEKIIEKPVPFLDPGLRAEIETQVSFVRQQLGHLDQETSKISSALARWNLHHPPEAPDPREQVRKALKGKTTAELGDLFQRETEKRPNGLEIRMSHEDPPQPIGTITPTMKAILNVLAQFPERTQAQTALLSGYSPTSGGFYGALAALRRFQLIEGSTQGLRITPAGRGVAGDVEPLPADLLGYWAGRLKPTEAAVLRTLAEAHPDAVPQVDVATRSGYSPTSGGFYGALAKLRKLDLIEGGSTGLRITNDLMEA